jgi:hypothetical protein
MIAYDAWGHARAASDWNVTLGPDTLDELGIGFTGHPQISACSGGLTKRRPTYIWDAPIDDWAATAADFIPGVSHATTAYDAYQRIQNGEDPFDIQRAAGDLADGVVSGTVRW